MSRRDVAVAEAKTWAEPEEPAVVRCPSCLGLRTISYRNRDTAAHCLDRRLGRVVPLSAFHAYWLERFSHEELREMAQAIWEAGRHLNLP